MPRRRPRRMFLERGRDPASHHASAFVSAPLEFETESEVDERTRFGWLPAPVPPLCLLSETQTSASRSVDPSFFTSASCSEAENARTEQADHAVLLRDFAAPVHVAFRKRDRRVAFRQRLVVRCLWHIIPSRVSTLLGRWCEAERKNGRTMAWHGPHQLCNVIPNAAGQWTWTEGRPPA